MKYYIEDQEFGKIILSVNGRAKHFVMRVVENEVHITVPQGMTREDIEQCVNRNRESIRKLMKKDVDRRHVIDLNYKIDTDVMKLELVEGKRKGFYVHRSEGKCTIECEANTDFASIQNWLKKVIINELKLQAKFILRNKTQQFADKHGFKFTDLKIQSSKTRWGSCSASNSINLSVFLMTLPSHLMDYVILHELCHTIHHDHSDAFWALMDKVTDGKAHALRKELKQNYSTEL